MQYSVHNKQKLVANKHELNYYKTESKQCIWRSAFSKIAVKLKIALPLKIWREE